MTRVEVLALPFHVVGHGDRVIRIPDRSEAAYCKTVSGRAWRPGERPPALEMVVLVRRASGLFPDPVSNAAASGRRWRTTAVRRSGCTSRCWLWPAGRPSSVAPKDANVENDCIIGQPSLCLGRDRDREHNS